LIKKKILMFTLIFSLIFAFSFSKESEARDQRTIIDIALQYGELHKMVEVLNLTELYFMLKSTGSKFTLFAPVDEAFSDLSQQNINYLLNNPDKLKEMLLYHILSGEKTTFNLKSDDNLQTLLGNSLQVKIENGEIEISDAHVITANILGINGVIHTIDKVLKPTTERKTFKEPRKN
jgi:transforming growth factor-beta-induced protein